jgi:hypothetical protein
MSADLEASASNREGRFAFWFWVSVVAVAGAALVMGFFGSLELVTRPSKTGCLTVTVGLILHCVYTTLQLFVLNVTFDPHEKLPLALNLARFLAPAATIGTAIKAIAALLDTRWAAWKRGRLNRHVVVCGLGRKGSEIVRQLRADGDKVVLIDAEGGNDLLDASRELGAHVVIGNAVDGGNLLKARLERARELFVFTDSDSTNIGILLHAAHVRQDAGCTTRLTTHVHLADPGICPIIRDERALCSVRQHLDLWIVNAYERAVRDVVVGELLPRMPVAPDSPRGIRVMIGGFGRMGQALALQIARTCIVANGKRPHLTVVDVAAKERIAAFCDRHPHYRELCDLDDGIDADLTNPAVLADLASRSSAGDAVTTVALCMGDDYRNFTSAMILAREFAEEDETAIFVRLTEADGLGRLLDEENSDTSWARRLKSFGSVSTVCALDRFRGEDADAMARSLHASYIRDQLAQGQSPDTKPALSPWEDLSWEFRDSNLQAADHLRLKLLTIGWDLAVGRGVTPVEIPLKEGQLDLLAELEHRRWFAERVLKGWQFSRERNAKTKKTPCLVPWEKLTDVEKKWDQDQVRAYAGAIEDAGMHIVPRL